MDRKNSNSKCILAILSCAIFSLIGQSQDILDSAYFAPIEHKLVEQYNQLLSASDYSSKKILEQAFQDSLMNILTQERAFNYSFSQLKKIGRIISPDEKLVLFTWNIPQTHGFHNYYGIIQYYNKKLKAVECYSLKEHPGLLTGNKQGMADIHAWTGGLYYSIVPAKHKGQLYYTLLGFHFNDLLSNYKIIEVLAFDKDGIPYFPTRQFNYEGKVLNRIVLEYSESAQVSLRYDQELEKIIFDHLSPYKPSLQGQYQYYGPDFSYDALYFEAGVWIHEPDITITN